MAVDAEISGRARCGFACMLRGHFPGLHFITRHLDRGQYWARRVLGCFPDCTDEQALLLPPPPRCQCRCSWLQWGHRRGLPTEPTFKAQAWDTVQLVSVDAKNLVPVAEEPAGPGSPGTRAASRRPRAQTAGQDHRSGSLRTIGLTPQGLKQMCVHLLLSRDKSPGKTRPFLQLVLQSNQICR